MNRNSYFNCFGILTKISATIFHNFVWYDIGEIVFRFVIFVNTESSRFFFFLNFGRNLFLQKSSYLPTKQPIWSTTIHFWFAQYHLIFFLDSKNVKLHPHWLIQVQLNLGNWCLQMRQTGAKTNWHLLRYRYLLGDRHKLRDRHLIRWRYLLGNRHKLWDRHLLIQTYIC